MGWKVNQELVPLECVLKMAYDGIIIILSVETSLLFHSF